MRVEKEENNKKPYKIKKAYKNLPLFIFFLMWRRREKKKLYAYFFVGKQKMQLDFKGNFS